MRPNLSVLHINTFDNRGGSGRSSYRIHLGLKGSGVRSRMLVGCKVTEDENVGVVCNNWGLCFLDRICNRITNRLSLQYLLFPSSFLIPRHQWLREADIIQLYNTHGGYFSHTVLASLSRNRPVVWRLSDMWPMTGHCAYSYECGAWETGCGSCPCLKEYPSLMNDTTRLLWKIKEYIYKKSELKIVAPSKWIAKLAKRSPLLRRFPIYLIPNGVDLLVFRPIPKKIVRRTLGIPLNQRIILFSAEKIDSPRKGGVLLANALAQVTSRKSQKITLLVVGKKDCGKEIMHNLSVKYIDYVDNNSTMAALYSAVDMFVLPTLADNFPNAILESMACGTPVVSFNVGGISEAIRHMETGYLATPKDTNDLVKGLKVLLDDSIRHKMSIRCREIVEKEYSLDVETKRFNKLYYEILQRG